MLFTVSGSGSWSNVWLKRWRYPNHKVIGLPGQLDRCRNKERFVGVSLGSSRSAWSDVLTVVNRLRILVYWGPHGAAWWVSCSYVRCVYPPNNQDAIPPTSPLSPPFPIHIPIPHPFPSSPLSLVLPSLPLHSFSAAKWPPWNLLGGLGSAVSSASGVRGEGPADIDFGVFWEGKSSFDSNYYMDFCILKFVKLLIKFPQNCSWSICWPNGR